MGNDGSGNIYLHIHRNRIYRLIKQPKIPAFHVGSGWRFNAEAIDHRLLEQQQKAGRQWPRV